MWRLLSYPADSPLAASSKALKPVAGTNSPRNASLDRSVARELPHTESGFDQFLTIGDSIMGGKAEEIKGRVKEAAGAITDNNKLRREGKTDQVVGKVKQAAEKAIDAAKNITKNA